MGEKNERISPFENTDIEKNIREFETLYKISFPEEYKRFLLKYNGGRTPKTSINLNNISTDIRAFYGFGKADEHYNFQRLIDNMNILGDYIKDGMLPIATTVFGDDITISIGEKNNGCIFFKYHDRSKKYIKLTDTLTELASKCKREKIGHIRTIEERRQSLIEKGKEKKINDMLIKCWQAEIDKYADMHQEEFEL